MKQSLNKAEINMEDLSRILKLPVFIACIWNHYFHSNTK